MSVQAKKWEQVSHRFEEFGDHLRSHFEQVGEQSAEERKAVEHALRLLGSTVEDSFTATGRAVRDPELRKDLGELATAVRDALAAAVEDTGGQVRERLSMPAHRARKVAQKAAPRKSAATPAGRKTAHETAHAATHEGAHKTAHAPARKAAPEHKRAVK